MLILINFFSYVYCHLTFLFVYVIFNFWNSWKVYIYISFNDNQTYCSLLFMIKHFTKGFNFPHCLCLALQLTSLCCHMYISIGLSWYKLLSLVLVIFILWLELKSDTRVLSYVGLVRWIHLHVFGVDVHTENWTS